jgi:hypothetical protein
LHQPDQAGGSRRHDLIPNLLPAVVTQGSYDVRDLSAGQSSRGNLSESSLVVDQTLGASVIPLGVTRCSCALDGPGWSPDAFFFLLADGDDLTDAASIDATDECDGTLVDASGDFTSWLSSDTAVATVATKKVTAVGAGTATATADGSILESTGAGTCAFVQVHPSAQVTVQAVPVNFHLTSAAPANDNVTPSLEADFVWQSSDGKVADIAGCFIKEHVTFPTTNNGTCPSSAQNCFFPASPPWAAKGATGSGFANPTDTAPGINAQVEAQHDLDSVGNLAFVKPYSASPFSGTQIFQYSCNGGSWVTLYGPITINYSMAKNSAGMWQVVVSRSDTPTTSVYLIPNQ